MNHHLREGSICWHILQELKYGVSHEEGSADGNSNAKRNEIDDYGIPTCIDSSILQENILITESSYVTDVDVLVDLSPMLCDVEENSIVLKSDLNEVVSNSDDSDLIKVGIKKLFFSYVDPIRELFLERKCLNICDEYFEYFYILKILENHVNIVSQFSYVLVCLIYSNKARLFKIGRYVHLYAFSPH